MWSPATDHWLSLRARLALVLSELPVSTHGLLGPSMGALDGDDFQEKETQPRDRRP